MRNLSIDMTMLKRRSNDAALVGLEIESGSIGAVEVQANGAAVTPTATASSPIPPGAFRDGEVSDPGTLVESLRALFADNKLSRRVRLGIANQRVVVRTVRLPVIEDPAELDSAVRFTAQEQIAMPLEQAVIDHRVIGGVAAIEDAPPQIDVIVVAARRDMISASLRPLRDAGLEPVGVDLSAFAMIRALAPGEPVAESDAAIGAMDSAAVLYCNVGDVSNLAVAKGRSCLFTRVSPIGIDDIAGSLSSNTGLSPGHAQMWLQHVGLSQPVEQVEGDPELVSQVRIALERGAASILDELRLSLDFYRAQEAAAPVERVVLCGPGGAIPGLAEQMEPALGMPIEIGRPEALAGLEAGAAARLTLPFGLALDN
jgi:type IV pilus assembly protein PilM